MPTDSQIAGLLYKSRYGVADTESTRQYYEEPFLARNIVYTGQIYSQDIPTPNPLSYADPDLTISSVVQVVHDLQLSAAAGAPNSFYAAGLIDCIPHNSDITGGTYNFILKTFGNVVIPFGLGDWTVDPAAGILRFYGTLPSGVSAGSPPKISFFRYVGGKGIAGGAITGALNVGTSGVGVFKNITGSTVNFHKLNSLTTGLTIVVDGGNDKIDFDLALGLIDHNSLNNLTTGDPHTQYVVGNGRTGGQIINGGSSASDNLILRSTSSVTKGTIYAEDPIKYGGTNVFSGKHAMKKIMASTGVTDICTLVFNTIFTQYSTVRFMVSAWDGVSMHHYISYLMIYNTVPGNTVNYELINEIAQNPKFILNTGTSNTFKLQYNGTIGDSVLIDIEYIMNGPNHMNNFTSIS